MLIAQHMIDAISIRDLYRQAVLAKRSYEKVRERIQTVSKILDRTHDPLLWRAAARRAVAVGLRRRKKMTATRGVAKGMILYDPSELREALAVMAESNAVVHAYEERRRRERS